MPEKVKNMMPIKVLLFTIICMLVVSGATMFPSHASSGAYAASYQMSESNYVTTSSLFGTTTAQYQVLNGAYSGQAENGTLSIETTNYVGISSGGNSSINMSVSSSYSNDTLKTSLSGNGGTLLYVAVSQNGMNRIVWSGVAKINSTTSTTISGLAYVNSSASATLLLGFASTNGIQKVATQLGASTVISLSLPQFTFSSHSSSTTTGSLQMIFPVRYKPIVMASPSINVTGAVNSPMVSVGSSVFLGASYPDMVWNGFSTVTVGFNGTTLDGTVTSRTAEFFGTNGTIAGYAQEFNLQVSKSLSIAGQSVAVERMASSTLIVSQPGMVVGGQQNNGFTIIVNGQAVIFERNSHGDISSTANIESQRGVFANGSSSTLLLLHTHASSYVLVNFSDNSSQSVIEAQIQSQKQTTVSEGGSTYNATAVNISATGNVIFNVTDPYPSVIVFKANSTGTFRLNQENYWTANGSVYVFDDPSTTYYIANAVSTNTHTSTTQPTTMGQSSTVTTQSSTTSAESTSGSSTFTLEIVAAVVVIIAAIGLITVTVRRKAT